MSISKHGIQALYKIHLNRDADPDGLQHFSSYACIEDVERAIVLSEEFKRSGNILLCPTSLNAWKICVFQAARLMFVPIAKNAHTSILGALATLHEIDWRALPFSDRLANVHGNDDEKIHFALSENRTGLLLKDCTPSEIDEFMRAKDVLRVTVFRDPVERLLSAYNHFFVHAVDNPVSMRHSRQIFEYFGKADGRGVGLHQMLKYIQNTPGHELDPHWAPQYEYISRLKIDRIIPIERLDLLEEMIFQRSGCEIKIGQLNVRRTQAHSAMEYISSELRDLIDEIYWLDRRLYLEALQSAEATV